jgi:hypothetical protein
MAYRDAPKHQPQTVDKCCSCPEEQQIPCVGKVMTKFENRYMVDVEKCWCGNCGLYLTQKDQDKYFPSKEWKDNR